MPTCLDQDTNVVDCSDPTCYTGPCAPVAPASSGTIYSAVSGLPTNNPGALAASDAVNNGGTSLSWLNGLFSAGSSAYAASQTPQPKTNIITPLGSFSSTSLTALVPVVLLVALAVIVFWKKK